MEFDDDKFRAGSLHDAKAIQFWREEILPTVSLPYKQERIILDMLEQGLTISDKFTPYCGMLFTGNEESWVSNMPKPPNVVIPNHKIADQRHELFLENEITKLLQQGVISVATEEPHVVMPLLVAENSEGKQRLILDARLLNCFLDPESFKLPSVSSILEELSAGDLLLKIDFKAAYYNLLVAKRDRKYVAFRWRGITYVFNAAVMGLNITPYHFQLLSDTVKAYICIALGCKGAAYLDDLLFAIPSSATLREQQWARWVIHHILQRAGFIRAKLKCSEEFATRVQMLGFVIDTIRQQVEVPEEKLKSTLALLERNVPQQAALEGTAIKLHTLQSLIGKLTHLTVAAPAIPLFLRETHDVISVQAPCFAVLSSVVIHLSKYACADLRELLQLKTWCRLTKWESAFPNKVSLTTDASGLGWGACTIIGGIPVGDFGGTFPVFAKQEIAIHVKERLAVQYALRLLPANITDAYLRVHVDNEIVRHTLLKGQKRDVESREFAKHLLKFQLERNIIIKVFRIDTKSNVRADWISRLRWRIGRPITLDGAELMLARHVFMRIQILLSIKFTVDAFASKDNRQLWRYVAIRDNKVDPPIAVNAFTCSFKREVVYANPPHVIIPAVWRHFKSCKATGVMIVPHKPAAEWWPRVITQSVRHVIIARKGQAGVFLEATSDFTKALGPIPWDLVACHFNFSN